MFSTLSGLYGELAVWILLATKSISTTYGYGELMCGDPGKVRPCKKGAVTASGDIFDPDIPSMAIAIPANYKMPSVTIQVRDVSGKCHTVRLNDKMNEKWIGHRGFDISPAAVELITGKPATPTWSGVIELCYE
jgi:hypothetical protein